MKYLPWHLSNAIGALQWRIRSNRWLRPLYTVCLYVSGWLIHYFPIPAVPVVPPPRFGNAEEFNREFPKKIEWDGNSAGNGECYLAYQRANDAKPAIKHVLRTGGPNRIVK